MANRKPKPTPEAIDSSNHMVDPDAAEQYWAHFYNWQKRLGLQSWRLVRSPLAPKGAMAEMARWDRKQRQASARLGLNWKATPVNALTLERTAVHELLHVLLADLIAYAKEPHTSEEDLANIEHGVINTLEELLVPGKES